MRHNTESLLSKALSVNIGKNPNILKGTLNGISSCSIALSRPVWKLYGIHLCECICEFLQLEIMGLLFEE